MRPQTVACLVFVILLSLAVRSTAAITAFWVPVASGDGSVGSMYPAAATTAPAGDPLLLSMQTWDLRVNTDGNWSSAGLRATLPGGSFFYRRLSDGTTSNGLTKPDPSLYPIFPNREFWTYVTVPGDSFKAINIQITGGFPQAGNLPSNGNPTAPVHGTFSIAWEDLLTTLPSPPEGYQIARLTFPLGMIPDVLTIDQKPDFSNTSQLAPDSVTAIPEIPEPSALILWPVAGLMTLRRRK